MAENPTPTVDGITPGAPAPQKGDDKDAEDPGKKAVKSMKRLLFILISIPYGMFIVWSIFLLGVLPDASGTWEYLIPIGKLLGLIAGLTLAVSAMFAISRIIKKQNIEDRIRIVGFIRIGAFVTPGLLFALITPVIIVREPPLKLYISNPDPEVEMIAPLAITFSAHEAVTILQRRGLSANSFSWDYSGDGTVNEVTVVPEATAIYDRQGGYRVVLTMALGDGTSRTLSKRVVLPKAVFSYKPIEPVVDEPILFSVEHLLPGDQREVREVQWDFDNDGIPDETSTNLQTTHTFLRTGAHDISVKILYTNQAQNTYQRVLIISEPKPLPFPVIISTVPEFLESPPPFQVVFSIETDEPIQDVVWDFGDGTREAGNRLGHTFKERGVFQVVADVRSKTGEIAKVSMVVRVVDTLVISDLTFDGSHKVRGDRIVDEAPITVELNPQTTKSLVNFFWEVPKASEVYSVDRRLRATFRREGIFNLILVGQDPEGAVLRKTIILDLKPPSSSVIFDMKPEQGVAPLLVQFDASESYVPDEVITGFVWDFGDQEKENEQLDSAKVMHVFQNPGTYEVSLTVYTTIGNSVDTAKTIVVRAPFLDACFLMSREEGNAPLGIRFDRACSTGDATKVLWDFGDGVQSDEKKNVIDHVFEQANSTFKVRLTLEAENGTISSIERTVRTN